MESATISGGFGNVALANGFVVTGGDSCGRASEGGTNAVILGGLSNDAAGVGAVAMGNAYNNANGDYSISFGGPNTFANNDHSMVINLMDFGFPPADWDVKYCSKDDGHFLAYAEQFTFQIGNNVDTRLIMNKDNIQNHIDALLETMKITNYILYLKQGIHFNEKKSTKKKKNTIKKKKKKKKKSQK